MVARRKKIFVVSAVACAWSAAFILDAVECRGDSTSITSTIDGNRLYENLCASCHGASGRPSSEVRALLIPPPADLTMPAEHEHVRRVIRNGRTDNMLHFDNRLTAEQIEAVADYVMKLKKSAP